MNWKALTLIGTLAAVTAGTTFAQAPGAGPGPGPGDWGGGRRRGDGAFSRDRPPREAPLRELWVDPDKNGDCLVDEGEAEAAIKDVAEKMKERFKKRNEMVLQRFDEDKDGALSEAELAKAKAAREAMEQRMKEFREHRREGLRPGPDGEGFRPPPPPPGDA